MKKIVMAMISMIMMTIGANATFEIDPLIKECTLNPLSPQCHPTLLQGEKGDKGDTGATGATGADGITTVIHTADAEFTSWFKSEVDREVEAIQAEIKRASEFANDVVAMNMATSSIDFGTASEGSFELGLGLGYSRAYIGTGKAGALGFKYGTSENTAIVIKGSRSFNRSNTYSVGGGMTIKF